MITAFTIQSLEKIINAYVKLDSETLESLSRIQGKTAQIIIQGWETGFYVQAHASGFCLTTSSHQTPDTIIESSLNALFKLGFASEKNPALVSKEIKIQGDLEFGQALHRILRNIDIDWEEHLSRLVGDTAAYQMMKQARKALNWFKDSTKKFCENTTEYLQEEARYTPSAAEIEDFYQDIFRLRNDVDRTEKKIEWLLKKRQGEP